MQCSLCLANIVARVPAMCSKCRAEVMDLPDEDRRMLCLRVTDSEIARVSADAISQLATQMTELIALSQRWHPSHFVTPPPSMS